MFAFSIFLILFAFLSFLFFGQWFLGLAISFDVFLCVFLLCPSVDF
jgi:hypothetical protein